MHLRSPSQTTSLARRSLDVVVLLLFAGIVSLSAGAKSGQYLPSSNPAHNLSKVSKMTESTAPRSSKRVVLRDCPQPILQVEESTSDLPVLENVIPVNPIALHADQLRSPPTF